MPATLESPITDKNLSQAQQDAERLSNLTGMVFAIIYLPNIDSFAALPAQAAINHEERIVTLVNPTTDNVQVELKMATIPESSRFGYKARVLVPIPGPWSSPTDDQEEAIFNALGNAGFDPQATPPYDLIVTHIANEWK